MTEKNIRFPDPGRGLLVLLVLFIFPGLELTSAPFLPYPEIKSLLPSDPMLKQLQEDVAYYHSVYQSGGDLPSPGLYRYRTVEGDDLFALAARFNLPYETLASLNRISGPGPLVPEQDLLVPNQPGLFLQENPQTELESFIRSLRDVSQEVSGQQQLLILTPAGRLRVLFLPGERFHPMERAFFLGILFRNPLSGARLTSGFGTRTSPITGECHFHNGIDLAAPDGTPVVAARDGTVTAAGFSNTYGNYILISHIGGWDTFYAHLKKIFVELNERVTSTIIIGEVGSTGLTTGPHLHFELRRDGGPVDPETLLPGIRG